MIFKDRFGGKLQPPWLIALAAIVVGIACIAAIASLAWRPAHDAPVVLYPTYLAWTGQKTPYKELFDFNLPGTYAIYGFLGAITDLAPIKLQLANLVLLIVGGFLTVFIWPQKTRLVALVGYSAFVCLYLDWYSEFGLQREFFCTLIVTAACLAAVQRRSIVWIGLLAGCAFLIKPPTILAFVWVLVWMTPAEARGIARTKLASLWILGFGIPMAVCFAWLVHKGALGSFLEITRNYTPLYATMDGAHRTISGSQRVIYTLQHLFWPMGDVKWIAFATAAVVALAWKDLDSIAGLKETVTLLCGVWAVLFAYPVFSGQFWRYHYLPFLAFSFPLLTTGLVVLVTKPRPRSLRLLGPAIAITVFLYVANGAATTLRPRPLLPAQVVADQVTGYLNREMRPTDTVQPLDWTGGMVEGMLNSRAGLATSFTYDFEFYHSLSNPYIQGLRRRFIRELNRVKPRFVLERLGEEKPWPSGRNTSREFPELRQFLVQNYIPDTQFHDFTIWVWKVPPHA